jgi:hypothetical protein
VSLPITLRITRGAAPPPEPPAGDWEFSNLPSGMTLAYDEEWDAASVPGGWSIASRTSGTNPVMATGQTPPSGDTYVIRHTYDGVLDGNEPNFVYRSTAGVDEAFFGFIFRFGALWDQPNGSGLKFLIIGGVGAGAGFTGWVDCINANNAIAPPGGDLPYLTFTTDSVTTTPSGRTALAVLDQSAATLTPGTWYKLELHLRKGGSGDLCKMWIDNTVVVDTDVTYGGSFAWSGALQFGGELQQVGTLGGGTGITGNANHIAEFDRTALWRRT